jgi:hypothetical protein
MTTPQAQRRPSRKLSENGGVYRHVKLDGDMEKSEILDLLRKAKDNQQYTMLTFDEVTFDATIAAAVVDLFLVSARFGRVWEKLNVEFCEGPTDLIVTAAMMMDCVKYLFLASDQNQEEVMLRFSTTLRINTSLQSLWLLIPFSEACAASLGEALAHNVTLDKLSLSGSNWDAVENEDTDADADDDDNDDDNGSSEAGSGAAAAQQAISNAALLLAKGLGQNEGLRTLDISCCYLQDDALAVLIGSLVGHPYLQDLDLSRNLSRGNAIKGLAELVQHHDSKVTKLDLREQTRKNPLALSLFSQALVNNETLQTLKLSNNQLHDHHVVELVRALQGNSTLQELDLQHNRITERGLSVLTRHLPELSALAVLLLGGNAFGKEGFNLLESLPDNDDSICTVNETDMQALQHGGSYSILGDIYED